MLLWHKSQIHVFLKGLRIVEGPYFFCAKMKSTQLQFQWFNFFVVPEALLWMPFSEMNSWLMRAGKPVKQQKTRGRGRLGRSSPTKSNHLLQSPSENGFMEAKKNLAFRFGAWGQRFIIWRSVGHFFVGICRDHTSRAIWNWHIFTRHLYHMVLWWLDPFVSEHPSCIPQRFSRQPLFSLPQISGCPAFSAAYLGYSRSFPRLEGPGLVGDDISYSVL